MLRYGSLLPLAARARSVDFSSKALAACLATNARIPSQDDLPLSTGRPKLVVVGTGWGGARLLKDIDTRLYDLTVISQRNHMVFTPLLASTTVGTLDPRSVAVHITDIQKGLLKPQNAVYVAEATAVDAAKQVVHVRSEDGIQFEVKYDKLVLATGSQGSTFGIPGVLEHTNFLRDVTQAEAIRHKLMDNLAKAGIPGRLTEEWHRILHIVIVGGGPTGVEVAGELTDFIKEDLRRIYPGRAKGMRVTLIEAREVLGSFDPSLREYAAKKLVTSGVDLRKGVVKQVSATEVTLMDGTVIPYGLCIWSTGVGPTPFTQSLPFAKTAVGRLAVDKQLRVLSAPPLKEGEASAVEGVAARIASLTPETHDTDAKPSETVPHVWSIGDCSATPENPLPALAQVAEQQGAYLAMVFNAQALKALGKPEGKKPVPSEFVYKSLGSMATVGGYSGILQLDRPGKKGIAGPLSIAGWVSWFAWRSAYLTRLGDIRKRILVASNWTLTFIFGRDMSRW